MTIQKTINIDGTEYPLVLSDEPETLLAAKAAGRVVVGIGADDSCDNKPGDVVTPGTNAANDWLPVKYVAESLPVDETWLEGVARRELGIPWIIARTDRLIIREFSTDDCSRIPDDADDSADEAILKDPVRLQAYTYEQYAFFNCGMWAVIRKEDGLIVGMLSLIPVSDAGPAADTDPSSCKHICELGYHIYTPYRRCGYAREASARIVELLSIREISVIARVNPENRASVNLLKSLGFKQRSADCFLRPYFV